MNNELQIDVVNDKPVVSSRLIAKQFDRQHKTILAAISQYINSIQNHEEYFLKNSYTDVRGREQTEYLLTRDGFSLVVMGFNGESALQWKLKYIEAFNAMESELKNQNAKMLPSTYKEALKALVEEVEKNELLLSENNKLAPKAEYCDNVIAKEGLINTSVIAKDAGLRSAAALNQAMFEQKIIYRESSVWKPYANYEFLITDGYADYQSYANSDSHIHLKWTEKGRQWILENVIPKM